MAQGRIPEQERRGLAKLIKQLASHPTELRELNLILLALRHAARDCDLQTVAAMTIKLDAYTARCRAMLSQSRAAKSPKSTANFVDNREKSHNSATIKEYDMCTVGETVERELT